MQFIQGNNLHQTYFTTPYDQVSADNAVRLMVAFNDKLDLQKLGFTGTVHKSEGRPPYEPGVLLKLYCMATIRWSSPLLCPLVTDLQSSNFSIWKFLTCRHWKPNHKTHASFQRLLAFRSPNAFLRLLPLETRPAKPWLHSSAYYHFVQMMHSCARLTDEKLWGVFLMLYIFTVSQPLLVYLSSAFKTLPFQKSRC